MALIHKKYKFFYLLLFVFFLYYLLDLIIFLNSYKKSTEEYKALLEKDEKVKRTEAIIVLAGDKGRIKAGILLLKKRKSNCLIVSGTGSGISKEDILSSQGDSAYAIQEIWDKIVIENVSNSTVSNVEESLKLINSCGKINRLIIVTSDYHIKRAKIAFTSKVKGIYEIYSYAVPSNYKKNVGNFTKLFIEHLKLFLFSKTAFLI